MAVRKVKTEKKKINPNIFRVFSHRKKFSELEKIIGFSIKNRTYFIQALMHRSFLEHNSGYDVSNERLEFLGDSILNLAVAEYLYEEFPDKDEGFLTKVRAKLVNRIALADAADSINLASFLLISKNLSNNFKNSSRTVLADAFEALIGAVYLDNGLNAAKVFIGRVLIDYNMKEGVYLIDENFKSQLLEFSQANKMENPVYSVIKEEGPQHNRTFTVHVTINNIEYGIGKGKNKKSAEQNAARDALNNLIKENSIDSTL